MTSVYYDYSKHKDELVKVPQTKTVERFYTISDFARYLKLNTGYLTMWRKRGLLPTPAITTVSGQSIWADYQVETFVKPETRNYVRKTK